MSNVLEREFLRVKWFANSEYAGQVGEVLLSKKRPGPCYLLRFDDGQELWFRERELQAVATPSGDDPGQAPKGLSKPPTRAEASA